MTRVNKNQFSRDFWLSCAGDDVMGVIRVLDRDDWKRDILMKSHIETAYPFALIENARIDFAVKNAGWLKPAPSSEAGLIVARRERDRIAAIDEHQNLRGVAQASAEVPLGGAVSTPSPAPASGQERAP